jgi:ribonuclease HI
MGTNKEVFDAELKTIGQAMRRFAQINQTDRHYTIFSDSQAALRRCSNDRPGPGQAQARDIIDGEKVLKMNNCTVMLRWVPGHKGVPGNEQADAMAKRAAKEPPEDAYSKRIMKTTSLTYLARKTTETRTKATKEWIETRTAKNKAYIPRK